MYLDGRAKNDPHFSDMIQIFKVDMIMLFHLFSAPFVVTAIVAAPIIFIQIKCRVAEAGEQGADFYTDHWYYRNLCKYS